jgi:hypothetical protein
LKRGTRLIENNLDFGIRGFYLGTININFAVEMLLNKSRSKGTVIKYNFHHFVENKVQASLTKQPIDDSALLECTRYGKDKILNDIVNNTQKSFNKTASSAFFCKMEP